MDAWQVTPQNSFGDVQLTISKDFSVPIAMRSGVYVGAQSSNRAALPSEPIQMLPEYIRAAMALKGGLATDIAPQEGDLGPLSVDEGGSKSVFILVGKKP
ncbi:hypothetical protein HDF16_003904 [Granulicella aggregans]|uniref:Uncharacterized protein n=1 Tax=Granulicella aggregans TaxID=474949 RepID=A0A7W7ZG52_9BACT|nr:hypothetical protein [Granulicella aggregans]